MRLQEPFLVLETVYQLLPSDGKINSDDEYIRDAAFEIRREKMPSKIREIFIFTDKRVEPISK